jgi:hypothetical protein
VPGGVRGGVTLPNQHRNIDQGGNQYFEGVIDEVRFSHGALDPSPFAMPATLFHDRFEVGKWNGLWVKDSQNDCCRSTQRATAGSWSAEVDGSANKASLATATAIDVSDTGQATLTFDWLIESGFDFLEYLSPDVSACGGASWTLDVRRLCGNADPENVRRALHHRLCTSPAGRQA